MSKWIFLDFSHIRARKRRDDYGRSCPHDPEHEVYESKDGPIHVCQLGDIHLRNAYALWADMPQGKWNFSGEEILPVLFDEMIRRGFDTN